MSFYITAGRQYLTVLVVENKTKQPTHKHQAAEAHPARCWLAQQPTTGHFRLSFDPSSISLDTLSPPFRIATIPYSSSSSSSSPFPEYQPSLKLYPLSLLSASLCVQTSCEWLQLAALFCLIVLAINTVSLRPLSQLFMLKVALCP